MGRGVASVPISATASAAGRDETSSAEQALVAGMQENHRSRPPVSAAPPARPSVPSPSGAGVGTTAQPLAVLGDCMVGLGLVVLIFGPELFVKKKCSADQSCTGMVYVYRTIVRGGNRRVKSCLVVETYLWTNDIFYFGVRTRRYEPRITVQCHTNHTTVNIHACKSCVSKRSKG